LQWDEKLTKQAFNSIDLNKNGLIEYKEFVC
jgi:Ca2+-binding EF-hand superfamily protein